MVMHESEERGKLVMNGKPMSDETVARLISCDLKTYRKCLSTLLHLGVCYQDEDGIIFNKRMIKDEELRCIRKEAGSLGGNPKLTTGYNKSGFLYAMRRDSDMAVKIGIASNVINRLYKIRTENKPDFIELLDTIAVDDMGTAEAEAHKKMSDKRIMGEWFILTTDDLNRLGFLVKGKSNQSSTPSSSSSSSFSNTNTNNTGRAPKKVKPFTPPSMDMVKEFFKQEGYKQDVAERAWKGYSANSWKDSRNNPVRNWKSKMINVWFTEENKINPTNSEKILVRSIDNPNPHLVTEQEFNRPTNKSYYSIVK